MAFTFKGRCRSAANAIAVAFDWIPQLLPRISATAAAAAAAAAAMCMSHQISAPHPLRACHGRSETLALYAHISAGLSTSPCLSDWQHAAAKVPGGAGGMVCTSPTAVPPSHVPRARLFLCTARHTPIPCCQGKNVVPECSDLSAANICKTRLQVRHMSVCFAHGHELSGWLGTPPVPHSVCSCVSQAPADAHVHDFHPHVNDHPSLVLSNALTHMQALVVSFDGSCCEGSALAAQQQQQHQQQQHQPSTGDKGMEIQAQVRSIPVLTVTRFPSRTFFTARFLSCEQCLCWATPCQNPDKAHTSCIVVHLVLLSATLPFICSQPVLTTLQSIEPQGCLTTANTPPSLCACLAKQPFLKSSDLL
eukprot:635118-Pelagomonas_calceolata.AAC.8